jgi:hypothetical protein
MPDFLIEQALYGSDDLSGHRLLAHSPGFSAAWQSVAANLCAGFGERPAGVTCPAAVFAQPVGMKHVAVVRVADDPDRAGALRFHLLLLPHDAYAFLGGDPFALSDRFPLTWDARGNLSVLTCPAEAPPRRTVADIQALLARHKMMQPTLLGAVQALVDGGRVVFERKEPAPDLIRALWTLLPNRIRAQLWPASFAFGNPLGFDVLALPRAEGADFAEYLREDQAGDYPEGRYEHSLQIAAEAGDQAELDFLFARRGRRDVLRLALLLVIAALLFSLAMNFLSVNTQPPAPSAPDTPRER